MALGAQLRLVSSAVVRRLLLPLILALVSVSSTVAAVRAAPPTSSIGVAGAPGPLVAAQAPVLTPRRLPSVLARPVGDAQLVQGLDALVAASPGQECLLVTQGDRVLYDRASSEALAPASGMKLVTATAVLAELGPDERLRTSVEAAQEPSNGIIEGDLWLVGGGDPVLGTADWAGHFDRQPALFTPLEELADAVAGAGLREVRGRIVGDDGRFDSQRYVSSWPARYVDDNEIGPMSSLWVNDGFVEWEPKDVPFADPAAGAAGVFAELLRQRGVTIGGEAASGPAPEQSVSVAGIDSPSMAELVATMLRESDNGSAELLIKELGRRVGGSGSTDAGRSAVAATLSGLGLPVEGLVVADGSGLDPSNRVSCLLLHDLVERAEPGDAIDQGLAVAGVSGTLARRFVDSPVSGALRGKTGSIRGVASLSGIMATRDEGKLTFSTIQNGIDRFDDGLPFQNSLASVLVAYPALPSLEEIGPDGYPDAA